MENADSFFNLLKSYFPSMSSISLPAKDNQEPEDLSYLRP